MFYEYNRKFYIYKKKKEERKRREEKREKQNMTKPQSIVCGTADPTQVSGRQSKRYPYHNSLSHKA